MDKNIILKIDKKKSAFSKSLELTKRGGVTIATIKNKPSCLKKAAKQMCDKNVLIACGLKEEKICSGKVKEFKDFSPDVFTPILEKICRLAAKRFSLTLPYGEIYVVADREGAQKIIDKLHSFARFFSIVCTDENMGEMFDGLYYKYGTPVRQIRKMELKKAQDEIIINTTDQEVRCHKEIPVIELGKASSQSIKSISAGEIYIRDENVSEFAQIWGGKSGASLYTLLRITPTEGAVVEIDKTADKIFLLDTEKF